MLLMCTVYESIGDYDEFDKRFDVQIRKNQNNDIYVCDSFGIENINLTITTCIGRKEKK